MSILNRLKNKLQAGAQTAVAPKAAAAKPLDIKKVLAKGVVADNPTRTRGLG
jgi:hypothetical protein